MITRDFWVTLLILTIISICSFIGGFLVGKGSVKSVNSEPVLIYGANSYPPSKTASVGQNKPISGVVSTVNSVTAGYFASKRGKKYYPISCLSSSKLKVENRVYFDDTNQAEKKGLTASDGC